MRTSSANPVTPAGSSSSPCTNAFLTRLTTLLANGMSSEIVGREEELGYLHAFVDQAGRGPSALVLEGEAGIGKSTLWLAGVEHARA